MAEGEGAAENEQNKKKAAQEAADALRNQKEIQDKLQEGLTSYYQTLMEIQKLREKLQFTQQQQNKYQEELNRLKTKEQSQTEDLTDEERERKEVVESALENLNQAVSSQKANLESLQQTVKETSKWKAGLNSVKKRVEDVGKSIKDSLVGELRNAPQEMLETTKQIKEAEKRMGMLSKQNEAFTDTLSDAAQEATALGSTVGEMAQRQAEFASSIGRTVRLTEEGHEAMAELAEGTTLGSEGAAEFAAKMENFGVSVGGTRDIMNNMVQSASDLGVSVERVTENMQKGAELAQRFHFEEGMEGMRKMAEHASKLRMEMDAAAPLAEKVFNVEGAVETAAQLQVMGGEVSKMADPFKLMFQARHDFRGLTESLGEATKGMASFNEETGEFEIEGLQLHRMREIAERTGVAFEDLSKAAKEANKRSKIQSEMSVDLPDEQMEFVKSVAQFDKEKGGFTINIGGEKKLLSELHTLNTGDSKGVQKMIENRQKEEKNLEKIAKQSQTFDEAFKNFTNAVKATILPGFKSFTDALTGGFQNFQEKLEETGLADKLKEFGKTAGSVAKAITKFVVNNPVQSAIMALLGSTAKWFMRGKIFGQGAMTSMRGGGMPGGGTGSGITPGGRATASGAFRGRGIKTALKSGQVGKAASKTMGGAGMLAKRGLKAGGRLGGATALLSSGIGNAMSAAQGEQSWGEAAGRTAISGGLGVAGGALGSFLGPMGTVAGGYLGSKLGGQLSQAMLGKRGGGQQKQGSGVQRPNEGQKMNDFIMRPGEGAVPFDNEDTVVGMKQGGPLEKTIEKEGTGEMSLSFDSPLEIRGTIDLKSDNDDLGKIDLTNDPKFAREISRMVQQELSKAIDGGKLNPNPSVG